MFGFPLYMVLKLKTVLHIQSVARTHASHTAILAMLLRAWTRSTRAVAPRVRHLADLPPGRRAQLEEELLSLLRSAPHLDTGMVKVSDVMVQSTGHISCELELQSGACPHRQEIESSVRETALQLGSGWSSGCSIAMRIRQPRSFMGAKAPESLRNVGALVGISSCKGGVGKSTVAANLAFALAELGGRVGLLDADVHGPSLPSLVKLADGTLPLVQRASDKLLVPPLIGGVKLMSYGFIAKGAASGRVPAAVMRGPMVGKVVGQMLSGTEWGELDYLLVDLPPGTGDVQLTLCQSYGLTAALVVTTPQRLARVDVEKGIDMFRELGVPVAGLIENMAYFTDPQGGVHYPFGRTQLEGVRKYANVDTDDATRLPIEEAVSIACDDGSPLVVAQPHSEAASRIRAAAARLTLSLARLQSSSSPSPAAAQQLRFDPRRGIVMRVLQGEDEGREFVLPRSAFADIPGAPGQTVASSGIHVGGLELGEGASGAAVVVVQWRDGTESVLQLEDYKRLCAQAASTDADNVR
jgi:Mrp family chromosome partitioning ATPase